MGHFGKANYSRGVQPWEQIREGQPHTMGEECEGWEAKSSFIKSEESGGARKAERAGEKIKLPNCLG